MPRVHPKTWEEGVMPLSEFPEDKRDEILAAVEAPTPPQRWIRFVGASMESRAWYEWHWHRGLKLRTIPGEGRRRMSQKLRRLIIARDGLICGICGGSVERTDVHIDHVHPVSRGGTDDPDNLQVAHSLCNIRKGAKV